MQVFKQFSNENYIENSKNKLHYSQNKFKILSQFFNY